MSQATDQLYEEYKEKRAERAQAAADRRSESPRAKFDLPLIDYDERHAETEPAAHLHQMAPVAQAEPVAHVKFEAEPQSEPVPVVPVIATSTSNQWTNKHIKEEHDAWEMRQWTRHIRDVHRASPLHYEEQEAEARRVASKGRERENARAPYGYSYRGACQPSAQEPFHYPYHHGQAQRTVTAHQTAYDQRYGNSLVTQSARSMPCTFIKHKNPVARGDAHVGRAAKLDSFQHTRNPSGYEAAAQAAYAGTWQ